MTRFEKIKAMTIEEMADMMCENFECEKCPAQERCWRDHNGMKEFLEEEIDEN